MLEHMGSYTGGNSGAAVPAFMPCDRRRQGALASNRPIAMQDMGDALRGVAQTHDGQQALAGGAASACFNLPGAGQAVRSPVPSLAPLSRAVKGQGWGLTPLRWVGGTSRMKIAVSHHARRHDKGCARLCCRRWADSASRGSLQQIDPEAMAAPKPYVYTVP